MTYIKMLFSLSSGIGKHFIGNTLCTYDDSVLQLIHIFQFFVTNSALLQTPRSKATEE